MDVYSDPHPYPESPVAPEPSDPTVTRCGLVELVLTARKGDGSAWNELVSRYTPLVDSVTRRYRLSLSDAEDASQVVWLRLFENLRKLHEPRALPGWIKTTTKNEALRLLALRRRAEPTDPSVLVTLDPWGSDEGIGVESAVLRSERDRALLDGLAELTPHDRNLLVLLHAEPSITYREISKTLGVPLGSIGPTRARCLNKLRNTRALRTFLRSEADPEHPVAA
jgi:RNA polymerase sigma factor (sigma-70 family)